VSAARPDPRLSPPHTQVFSRWASRGGAGTRLLSARAPLWLPGWRRAWRRGTTCRQCCLEVPPLTPSRPPGGPVPRPLLGSGLPGMELPPSGSGGCTCWKPDLSASVSLTRLHAPGSATALGSAVHKPEHACHFQKTFPIVWVEKRPV